MLRAMVFIDYENFNINTMNYYKRLALEKAKGEARQMDKPEPTSAPYRAPSLDYNLLPQAVVNLLPTPHVLTKTILFAPEPDEFLRKDPRRESANKWLSHLQNLNYLTVIKGSHIARPAPGYTHDTMDITDSRTYTVEEKGTDVNLAVHAISKGYHNAYDTAIIMSGDTDYIPVMDTLCSMGKNVAVVGVEGQALTKFKIHSDIQIILNDTFFQTCLRKKP